MNNLQNLRTDAHMELKRANIEWSDCVSKEFLPQWLAGAALSIEEVCPNENAKRIELDAGVYGDFPMPFRSYQTE